MQFKQYDVVKVLALLNPEKLQGCGYGLGYGSPKVGDIGTIVEIYITPYLGYDIECIDEQGATKWVTTFEASEIKMELL